MITNKYVVLGEETGYRKVAQRDKETRIVNFKAQLQAHLQGAEGNENEVHNAVVVYLNQIASVQNLFDADMIQNLLVGDAAFPEEAQAHVI